MGGVIKIRYFNSDGTYYLLNKTDNEFERTMVSVYLGKTKDEVIKSVNDLANIKTTLKNTDNGKIVVNGIDGSTVIFLEMGVVGMQMKYVAGTAYGLRFIPRRQDEIIDAIKAF